MCGSMIVMVFNRSSVAIPIAEANSELRFLRLKLFNGPTPRMYDWRRDKVMGQQTRQSNEESSIEDCQQSEVDHSMVVLEALYSGYSGSVSDVFIETYVRFN